MVVGRHIEPVSLSDTPGMSCNYICVIHVPVHVHRVCLCIRADTRVHFTYTHVYFPINALVASPNMYMYLHMYMCQYKPLLGGHFVTSP